MEALAATIYAFCAINAKQLLVDKDENKRICWEVLVNCTIDKDGKFTEKQVELCKKQYKDLP